MKVQKIANKLLGRGASGAVYLGLDETTGRFLAIKEIPLGGGTFDVVAKELAMVKTASHPNVVAYYGAEASEEEGLFRIYMEYVPGGSLAGLIREHGALPNAVLRKYATDVLKGLEYLHTSLRIVHRDIKPDNILLTSEGVCKLTDFGVSSQSVSGCVTVVGTPHYMPPEMLSGDSYGCPADIWSFGCAVYEMTTGHVPWSDCLNPASVMFRVVQSTEPPALPAGTDPSLAAFIAVCFERDPALRPTATAMLGMPFLETAELTGRRASAVAADTRRPSSAAGAAAPPDRSRRASAVAAADRSRNCNVCNTERALYTCDVCPTSPRTPLVRRQYCMSCWGTVHSLTTDAHHAKAPLLFSGGDPPTPPPRSYEGVVLANGRMVDVLRPEMSWACPRCTFLNHPCLEVCEMCGV